MINKKMGAEVKDRNHVHGLVPDPSQAAEIHHEAVGIHQKAARIHQEVAGIHQEVAVQVVQVMSLAEVF